MSVHLFGVTTERLTAAEHRRRREIAEQHDCDYYHAEGRSWFACRSYGAPFDGRREREVMAEVSPPPPVPADYFDE